MLSKTFSSVARKAAGALFGLSEPADILIQVSSRLIFRVECASLELPVVPLLARPVLIEDRRKFHSDDDPAFAVLHNPKSTHLLPPRRPMQFQEKRLPHGNWQPLFLCGGRYSGARSHR